MKFYQKTSGVWVLDNREIPAGTCYKVMIGDEIQIRTMGTHELEAVASYANFENEAGVAYASLEALQTATDNFFIGNESSALIDAVENSGGITYKSISVEITRPANTTAYAAGDVVADVSAAFVKLANVAKSAGTGVHITRVRIQTDDTGVSGTKFNLHLYREAPTFIADNAAFAVAYANATKRVGAIPVVMGTGNQNTIGMNDYNQVILNPVARDVYWILETVTGFTPSANSTKFTIAIDCELSNA